MSKSSNERLFISCAFVGFSHVFMALEFTGLGKNWNPFPFHSNLPEAVTRPFDLLGSVVRRSLGVLSHSPRPSSKVQ